MPFSYNHKAQAIQDMIDPNAVDFHGESSNRHYFNRKYPPKYVTVGKSRLTTKHKKDLDTKAVGTL